MESESVEFFEHVRTGYLEIASKNPDRFITLNGNLTIDQLEIEIAKKTLERLDASLG